MLCTYLRILKYLPLKWNHICLHVCYKFVNISDQVYVFVFCLSFVSYCRRTTTQSSGSSRAKQMGGGGAGSMWKFYTGDDSPGIKV